MRGKYVVVQRTGFMPYFLSEWHAGTDRWDCLRARALAFDGSAARRIAKLANISGFSAPSGLRTVARTARRWVTGSSATATLSITAAKRRPG